MWLYRFSAFRTGKLNHNLFSCNLDVRPYVQSGHILTVHLLLPIVCYLLLSTMIKLMIKFMITLSTIIMNTIMIMSFIMDLIMVLKCGCLWCIHARKVARESWDIGWGFVEESTWNFAMMICNWSVLHTMLCLVFLAILLFSWKMTKAMGAAMFFFYFIFVIVTLGMEYDYYSCPL